MTAYNKELVDLVQTVTPLINKAFSKWAWSSFTNGYQTDKNDTYFIGYRISGRMFPIVAVLKCEFPWQYRTWNGYKVGSTEYSNEMGMKGGEVEFDKYFTFTFSIEEEYIDRYDLDGVTAEFDEFKDIPVEKLVLDLTDKQNKFKKFTKKDETKIVKWAEQASKNMLLNIQDGIGKQVGRRFEEFLAVDEKLAMKHIPQTMKDVFLF